MADHIMYNSISPSRCNVLHLYILLDNNVYRPLKRLTIKTGTMSRTFFISSCLKYSHYCYDWYASFLVHCCFCLLLILILKNKIDWFSSNFEIVHVPKIIHFFPIIWQNACTDQIGNVLFSFRCFPIEMKLLTKASTVEVVY